MKKILFFFLSKFVNSFLLRLARLRVHQPSLRLFRWQMSRVPLFRFQIDRILEPGLVHGSDLAQDGSARMDQLPSNLSGYKDVVFVPPVLFDSTNTKLRPQVFRSARIIGANPIAFSADGRLIQEALFRSHDRNELAVAYLQHLDRRKIHNLSNLDGPRISGQVCLLSSFWDSFGHWVPEHFLKVHSLLQSGFDVSSMRFLIRSSPSGFKTELLAAAGIPKKQIIFWDCSFAVVDELIVPPYPQISNENLSWVSSIAEPATGSTAGKYDSIYLSREKQSYRTFINESEVQATLAEFGITTIFPEELEFKKQISIARSCSLMFGPQGSAFTLQIFMRPGGTLVEIFPRDRVHLFNRQVASVMSHKHYALTDARGPAMRGTADKSILVDTANLRTLLLQLTE